MTDRHQRRHRYARVRRFLPLTLILLVAAGVFGMHTLGHATHGGRATSLHATSLHGTSLHGGHDGFSHVHESAAQGHDSATAVAIDDAMAVPLGDGCCQTVATGHGQPQPPILDPTQVCLAILAAAALIVAMLLLSQLIRALSEAVPAAEHTRQPTVRGPPSLRLGLLLADLAVLRI